jgi:Ca-activated chloride channel family protein
MPIVTDLALVGLHIDIESSSISPRKLPDVYAGAPVVIFGRYRGLAPQARIEITGTSLGDPMRMSIGRDIGVPPAPGGGSWLAASWARARIRDLEDRYAAGAHDLEPTIVDVSKRFGVLSRFTAYVAIDRSEVVNRGGRLLQAVQPVEQPSGWGNAQSAPAASAPRGPQPGYAAYNGPSHPGGSMPPQSRSAIPLGRSGSTPPPPMAPMAQPAPMPQQRRSDDVENIGESAPASDRFVPRSAPPTPGYAAPPPASRRLEMPAERERGISRGAPAISPVQSYLDKLAAFVRDIEIGIAQPPRLRLIRQRMIEWVEDVRSVGGFDDLASAVETLVTRLSDALVTAALDGHVVAAIAAELRSLAEGSPPPGAPPKSRVAFWK